MNGWELILPGLPTIATIAGAIVLWRKRKPETEKMEAEAQALVMKAAQDFGTGAYLRLDRVEVKLDGLAHRVSVHSRWHVVYDPKIQYAAEVAGVHIPPAPSLDEPEADPAA